MNLRNQRRISSKILDAGQHRVWIDPQRLAEVSREEDTKAYLIDDESMIDKKWLEGVEVLGITSGASAPEYLIERLIKFFKKSNPNIKVETVEAMRETVKFPLPDDLVTMAKESEKGMLWVEKHRVASQR